MKGFQALPVLVGLSLCTASAAILYVWYKTRNSDRDEVDGAHIRKSKSKSKFSTGACSSYKITKVESEIANDVVPLVLGRNGAHVNSIESQTNTKISFRRKDETHQVCEISGMYENVMKAADLVKLEASRSLNVTEELNVPQSAYCKIIGRCGKTLQDICRRSQAQVHINAAATGDKNVRRIMVTGSRAHVNTAIRLIEEKVHEDATERDAETKREPRGGTPRSPSISESTDHSAHQQRLGSNYTSNERLNVPTSSNGGGIGTTAIADSQLKVYVSAIASPARFWVQMVGPQTAKLDSLVAEMTEYYSQPDNQAMHKVEDPCLGQIVAAMFKYDSKWYRARIVGILPNEFDPRNVVLDLFFLDYGDSEYVQPHEVFEIRTDFLTLRFQAIECFLAYCQPMYPEGENHWNRDAISRFEELTHVAKWKQLTAKIVTTKERFRGADMAQREGSPVPGIELYDTVEDREVSIAATLILESYAIPDHHISTPKPLSRYSSSESVLRSDGGNSSHNGSVAEKAMMFELTASLQNNGNNGTISPRQRSPAKFSASPDHKKTNGCTDTRLENNIQNTLSTSSQKKNSSTPKRELDEPAASKPDSANNNGFSAVESLANRSWSEIMEAESDSYT